MSEEDKVGGAMTHHQAQRERILDLLASGKWVGLPEILDLRVANYRARLSELRQQGLDIRCETTWVGRVRHSRYRLIVPAPRTEARQEELFGVSR